MNLDKKRAMRSDLFEAVVASGILDKELKSPEQFIQGFCDAFSMQRIEHLTGRAEDMTRTCLEELYADAMVLVQARGSDLSDDPSDSGSPANVS